MTPHVLRHTCARRLWELLGPDLGHDQALQTIADIMGHESLETTRIYTRPKGKDKAAALELLAGYKTGPIGPALRWLPCCATPGR